ncbi:Kelch repeat-containing protein [Talaromyces pinophilus]|nr:Kelch repeat-containing protein [Talaromyces pinophilus]
MKSWKFVLLGLSGLVQYALCTQGDICYVLGAKTSLVDDRLFFMSGNYSSVSFDSQEIAPSSSLFSLNLTSQFPVERSIPQALLNNDTIDSDINIAYESTVRISNGDATGALWNTNDTIYVFGGGFKKPTNTLSAYNVTTNQWKEVNVTGGNFNFGNRTSSQYVSVPESSLGFIYGGTDYMGGMIRFNASDPENLSWTNETLGDGSNGIEVPNLESGAMVYIPAGDEGILITFGGGNVTSGISPDSGWPYDSNWLTVYVYDIASHTWWAQKASGDAPLHRTSFCAVVTQSPDGSAFHITTYGGWSLLYQRSFEDVQILSIPSFTWIDATDLSNNTNKEQQVNSTIGRDSLTGACQAYRGAQMIVLGGEIRAGAYSLTNGACSNTFEPVRVLDLSTYEWKSELNTSASYEVPSVIYNKIGGDTNGGATSTVPAAGFADPTLASVLQKRVGATVRSSTLASTTPSGAAQSSSVNSGAIAGGVVGGVVALALMAGVAWFMIRRKRQDQADETPTYQQNWEPPVPPQEMEATYGRPEAGGWPIHEAPADSHAVEVGVTSPRHISNST